MPSSRSRRAEPRRFDWLAARPYAHRGLHGAGLHGGGRIENSRAAFAAAIAAGHGIELDVQLSRDGVAMVFHDATLDRLTTETGPVVAHTAAALGAIPLSASPDRIEPLAAILAFIAGRAALLIEVKAKRGQARASARAVAEALAGYDGPAAIMSFNPAVPRWFARHAPDVPRGLVVSEADRKGLRGRIERALSFRAARPDFLAYDIRDLPSAFAAARRAAGCPILTWTVRNPLQHEAAAVHADQIIYESV